MTEYVFEPEVSEGEWLTAGPSEVWVMYRSCPRSVRKSGDWLGLDRKETLLFVSLLRRVEDLLTDPQCRGVLEAVDDFVDGGPVEAFDEANHGIDAAFDTEQPNEAAERAVAAAREFFDSPSDGVLILEDAVGLRAGGRQDEAYTAAVRVHRALTVHLIRDIFGNPFRPVAFDPAWRTDTVLSLARVMYESRDFAAMPILADALQDAGCEHADILDHCRDPNGAHVRGCWVVDLVLGKA